MSGSAPATRERLGEALDELSRKGYWMIHEAAVRALRSYEGALKRCEYLTRRRAADLVAFVEQVEHIARVVPERLDPERPADDDGIIESFAIEVRRELPAPHP